MRTRENIYDKFLFNKIDESDILTGFIMGHLVIEHILGDILKSYDDKLVAHFNTLSHKKKIDLIRDTQLISDGVASCLQKINKIRNKFAHDLGYQPNKGDLLNIIRDCRCYFDDFTDGLEQLEHALEATNNLVEAQAEWGPGLADLFIQIAYDLESCILTNLD